jgi:hypothetical protein
MHTPKNNARRLVDNIRIVFTRQITNGIIGASDPNVFINQQHAYRCRVENGFKIVLFTIQGFMDAATFGNVNVHATIPNELLVFIIKWNTAFGQPNRITTLIFRIRPLCF